MERDVVENMDRFRENPQVRAVVSAVGRRYELEGLLLAWNVCRYGKLLWEMGVELGERFDEEKAFELMRGNAAFYNATKLCHLAMLRASAESSC